MLDSLSKYEYLFWTWRRIEGKKIYDWKNWKKALAVAPPNPHCTTGIKIDTNYVLVTSLAEFLNRYGVNKNTRTLVCTGLEVEIGPKATT